MTITLTYADGTRQTHWLVKSLTCDAGRVTLNLGYYDTWTSAPQDVVARVEVTHDRQ